MKRLLIIIAILVIGAFLAYLYVFHKPHRDVTSEDAKHEIESAAIIEDYERSVDSANAIYLDHTILVIGEVTEVDSTSIILAPGIYCHFHKDESTAGIAPGDRVEVKGRVVGYDDLFGELRMDFCHFVE
jgi:hypothetical protein